MRPYQVQAVCFLAALLIAVTTAEAKVFYSREGALKEAFPTASAVQTRQLFLSPGDIGTVERLSGATPSERLVHYYAGYAGNVLVGYAFIDTHTVRSMPETFMLVVSPEGKILANIVLAFHEPQEFLPNEHWLKTFVGKRLSAHLRLHAEIDGITGATLSTATHTAAVRKILAIHEIKLAQKKFAAVGLR